MFKVIVISIVGIIFISKTNSAGHGPGPGARARPMRARLPLRPVPDHDRTLLFCCYSGVSVTDPDAPRIGNRWTISEERELYDGFTSLTDIGGLAVRLGRKSGGVMTRLKSLGLVELDATGVERAVLPKPEFKPCATLASPGDPRPKRDHVKPGRPPMAGLNATEQYCIRIFRQIPADRRKGLYMIMRSLAAPGSLEETEPPPEDTLQEEYDGSVPY
jgi:hypothetical protein